MGSIAETPKIQRIPPSAGAEPILAALRQDGGVVIKQFLSAEEVDCFNAELDDGLANIQPGSKNPDKSIQTFFGQQTRRMTNLATRSQLFRKKILDNDLIHTICEAVFRKDSGDYWLNTAQVIDIGPGNAAQPLHRDQDQWHIFKHAGPDAAEATVNFFFALSRFTAENGATRILPGSHRWRDLTVKCEPEETIPCEMDAGDIALFSGKTLHGGGANITERERRRGLALSIIISYLTPEEAYPFLVPREIAEDLTPRAQRMIGFRSQYPHGSVGLWMSDYQELADYLNLKSAVQA